MAEDDNNPEDAIANYMQVRDGEEYLTANSRIGQLLVEGGQLERSHTWFDEQRAEYPQLRDQLYGLEADILARAGATNDAMQLLNEAVAQAPDSTSLRYARAMLAEQQDNLVLMEKDLRLVLAADPNNAAALNALGYTLADRTTRYAEALELVSRAMELQPNEPAILDSMGWVLFRTGRYAESVQYLSRAYGNFPDPEVAAHLGEALWVNGDKDGAMAVWQGALLRDPGHPILLDTLDRLGIDATDALPPKDSPAKSQP
jgi:tetratricopeptide (TPR) repeat protein